VKASRIWGVAALLYVLFSLWYVGLRGPLTPAEVDRYMEEVAALGEAVTPERAATLRAFLEADDGGEFFMLNLIRLYPGEVSVEGSDEAVPAREMLGRYTGYFMPSLFKRAGHPAFFSRGAGGYVESWGVEPDPGWTAAAAIRYRSRRDMMELATHPKFGPAHVFKLAAMEKTFAFPARGLVLFGPRLWVALILALVAALAHIRLLARTRTQA